MDLVKALVQVEGRLDLGEWTLRSGNIVLERHVGNDGPYYVARIELQPPPGPPTAFAQWAKLGAALAWLMDQGEQDVVSGNGWQYVPASEQERIRAAEERTGRFLNDVRRLTGQ